MATSLDEDGVDGVFLLHTACIFANDSTNAVGNEREEQTGAMGDNKDSLSSRLAVFSSYHHFVCDLAVLGSAAPNRIFALPAKQLFPCGHDNLLFLHGLQQQNKTKPEAAPATTRGTAVQMSISNCIIAVDLTSFALQLSLGDDDDRGNDDSHWQYPVDALPETYQWTDTDDSSPPLLDLTIQFNLTAAQDAFLFDMMLRSEDDSNTEEGKKQEQDPGVTAERHLSLHPRPAEPIYLPLPSRNVCTVDDEMALELLAHESLDRLHPPSASSSSTNPSEKFETPLALDLQQQSHRQAFKRVIENELFEMNCVLFLLAVIAALLLAVVFRTSRQISRYSALPKKRKPVLSSPFPSSIRVSSPTHKQLPRKEHGGPADTAPKDLSPLSLDPCFSLTAGKSIKPSEGDVSSGLDKKRVFLRRPLAVVTPGLRDMAAPRRQAEPVQTTNEKTSDTAVAAYEKKIKQRQDDANKIRGRFVLRPVEAAGSKLTITGRPGQNNTAQANILTFTNTGTRHGQGNTVEAEEQRCFSGSSEDENSVPPPLLSLPHQNKGSSFVEDYWGVGF